MTRPTPGYSELESNILIFVYENTFLPISSIWLTQSLFPETRLNTPEFAEQLQKVVEATEELLVKGLVDGNVTKIGKQLSFDDVKLRYKGKQEAIKERHRKAEFEKQLPELAKRANAVAAEMKNSARKK